MASPARVTVDGAIFAIPIYPGRRRHQHLTPPLFFLISPFVLLMCPFRFAVFAERFVKARARARARQQPRDRITRDRAL